MNKSRIEKLNKKGFFGSVLSDFFAMLFFILVIIVIFFLFKLKDGGTYVEIVDSFQGDKVAVDLMNILQTEVDYNDENISISKLIIYSVLDGMKNNDIRNAIVYNISNIYEKANWTNPVFTVTDEQSNPFLKISRASYWWNGLVSPFANGYEMRNCEPIATKAFLPINSVKNQYLTVVFSECKE